MLIAINMEIWLPPSKESINWIERVGMSLTFAILTYRHYVNMSIFYIDKFDMSILCQYMSL